MARTGAEAFCVLVDVVRAPVGSWLVIDLGGGQGAVQSGRISFVLLLVARAGGVARRVWSGRMVRASLFDGATMAVLRGNKHVLVDSFPGWVHPSSLPVSSAIWPCRKTFRISPERIIRCGLLTISFTELLKRLSGSLWTRAILSGSDPRLHGRQPS